MLKEFNAHLQKWAEPMLTGKRLFLGRCGDEDILEFEFEGLRYRSSVNVETLECGIRWAAEPLEPPRPFR